MNYTNYFSQEDLKSLASLPCPLNKGNLDSNNIRISKILRNALEIPEKNACSNCSMKSVCKNVNFISRVKPTLAEYTRFLYIRYLDLPKDQKCIDSINKLLEGLEKFTTNVDKYPVSLKKIQLKVGKNDKRESDEIKSDRKKERRERKGGNEGDEIRSDRKNEWKEKNHDVEEKDEIGSDKKKENMISVDNKEENLKNNDEKELKEKKSEVKTLKGRNDDRKEWKDKRIDRNEESNIKIDRMGKNEIRTSRNKEREKSFEENEEDEENIYMNEESEEIEPIPSIKTFKKKVKIHKKFIWKPKPEDEMKKLKTERRNERKSAEKDVDFMVKKTATIVKKGTSKHKRVSKNRKRSANK
ncbi:hypothetical protein SteCoe_27549 [Stentor coeruleus]|uniref:Uncharacterized protein n=1 Tax=Stentor coeruleus TaxID=5963 RepID=A0A1R2BAJ5_9CILI|nr:hypothetical protein SteCoe_27549 [Stentor coeruleus]